MSTIFGHPKWICNQRQILKNSCRVHTLNIFRIYQLMKIIGLAACPQDASNEIKEISSYQSPYNGGEGCVRDVIEQTLKVQSKWMTQDAFEW